MHTMSRRQLYIRGVAGFSVFEMQCRFLRPIWVPFVYSVPSGKCKRHGGFTMYRLQIWDFLCCRLRDMRALPSWDSFVGKCFKLH